MFGSIQKPEQPRLYWNNQDEVWVCEVDSPLPPDALRRIAAWGYKVNLDRWRGMKHGDNRERLGKALKKLQRGELRQVVTKKTFEIGFD